jgi:hypothetical protein
MNLNWVVWADTEAAIKQAVNNATSLFMALMGGFILS